MKEKTIPTSIRLKATTKKQLEEIATLLNCSLSQLISSTIEIGLAFVDSQAKKIGEQNGKQQNIQ